MSVFDPPETVMRQMKVNLVRMAPGLSTGTRIGNPQAACQTPQRQRPNPCIKRAGTITVTPRIYPLFQLVQSEAWTPIMEKYLGLDPGSHATFKSQRHQGRPHQDDLEPLPPSMEAWGRIQQRQATRIWPQGGGKRPAQKKRSRGRGRSKPN